MHEGAEARRVAFGGCAAMLAGIAGIFTCAALAGAPAYAADVPSEYTIAVHISHNPPPAEGSIEADAIVDLVTRRIAKLNKDGGIHGRRVRAVFYDDFEDLAKTKENVAKALADPNLIAMIGLWDSSRGAEVIDQIGASGVPLISELSVETLFSNYPNIYTLTRSVRHEQQVFQKFVEEGKYQRIAFVGADDDRYTNAYFKYIESSAIGPLLAGEREGWLKRLSENPPERIEEVIAMVKREQADLLFLSIGSGKGADFLRRLAVQGISIPVFLGRGSVEDMRKTAGGIDGYGGSVHELAEGGIANLHNERLEQIMRQPRRIPAGRGYTPKAVGYGIRYGDLVTLVTEAANEGSTRRDRASLAVPALRAAIAKALARLAEGLKVWRGEAQDWSFTPERASSERSLLIMRPPGQTTSILAPVQYVQTGSELKPVPVLRVHLDMLRIYGVNTNERSFEADFFFTLHSKNGIPLHSVEFTNAFRGPGSEHRLVNLRQVHQEPAVGDLPTTRVFRVSGKFVFEPDLRKYPFDEQTFAVSFQPESTASPFLLQPPSKSLIGYKFRVDGWTIRDAYVGSNDLIIRSVTGDMSEERIIPYYNFNYTWVMKRQVLDYVYTVLFPVLYIFIIAYLANFIPAKEAQVAVATQVTALLSVIALAVALQQPSADETTLSDQIFAVAYAAISLMTALSVVQMKSDRSGPRARVIRGTQIFLVPLAALGFSGYLIFLAASDLTLLEFVQQTSRDLMNWAFPPTIS